jgi:hypothetical protein
MKTRLLGLFAFALAAGIPAGAQTTAPRVPANGDTGFFRPAADPALTAIRPPASPAPAPPAQDPGKTVDVAVEIRKAEEARKLDEQMDRSEREHERARAEAAAVATAPASAVAVGTPASALPTGVPNEPTRY